jgi:hypothetical protein
MSEKPQITDCLNWQDADFRYLKLRLESRRKDTLNTELETRRENIEILSQALKECDIPFWIHGKTLLGIILYKQFLIEDHDDDIGVLSEYRTSVCSRLYPKLKENGFQAIRYNDTMLSVIRNDRYIDICFFEQDEDKIGYGKKWFPKKYFEKFDSVVFHGGEYPVPSNAEKLLEIMYPKRVDKQSILTDLCRCVKKAKNKLKQARRWIKPNILQKKIISSLSFEQFLDCKIEDDAAINWTLREPHLDLITNNGKLRKIGDIIEYYKADSRLEDIKNNHVIETDTSEPFEEPVNLNNRFWQTGNNYLFYCIYYGFRKNIVSYDMANNYIRNVKEPRLYSAEYFEKLPPMNDSEIEEMLKAGPIIINRNAIVHGKHRACAMIGRIIAGKPYIPFYIEERVPRFALKTQ